MDPTGQVHLLLGSPGQAPPALPESPWRMWVLTAEGPIDPVQAAARARVSPVAPRAERSLVTAVAADDVDGILRLGAQEGTAARDAARVLATGRLVALDAGSAADTATAVLRDVADPGASKVLRRHWSGLHVLVPLAPSVPALVPVSRVGLGLLLAELHVGSGRPTDALAVLRSLPSHPAVQLGLAATLLGNGEHDRVLALTTDLANLDDVTALTLVARSVAARTLGDLAAALDASCAALATGDRSPGVLAAALEERAHLYALADQDLAARADMEALAALATGLGPVEIPEATPVSRSGAAPEPVEQSRDRARERMRRRITGVGAPGTFGGRHHSTYREEIAAMFALGQTDAVEELLLGLLDAVEDEVAELGAAFDPTFFLTLADLYHDSGRQEDLAALRDRYAAAEARAALNAPPAGEGGVAPPAAAAPASPASDAAPVGSPVPPAAPAPIDRAASDLHAPAPDPAPVAASGPPGPSRPAPAPAPAAVAPPDPVTGPARGARPPEVTAPAEAVPVAVASVGTPGSDAPPAGSAVVPAPTTDGGGDLPVRTARSAIAAAAAPVPVARDTTGGGSSPTDGPPDPAADEGDGGDPAAEDPPRRDRPLTAVERTVRGPRVRSL